jgi:hypothetical protein
MTWRQAREYLETLIHRAPERFGYQRTRWTLQMVLESCWEWLGVTTLAGVRSILRRMRIRLKGGQNHLRSPDPRYDEKRLRIVRTFNACSREPRSHMFYLDEVSYERQPTLASAWYPMDAGQPRAELSHASDAVWRFIGAIDAHTGQVFTIDRKRTTTGSLHTFFEQLCAAYPEGDTLYVVMDNWPVHFHPDLLKYLQAQPYADDFVYPPSWSDLLVQRSRLPLRENRLPVVIVPLPTYSPWLNPIEKLWGKSRREISHMHRHAHQFDVLKQKLRDFFAAFNRPSPELLYSLGIYQL